MGQTVCRSRLVPDWCTRVLERSRQENTTAHVLGNPNRFVHAVAGAAHRPGGVLCTSQNPTGSIEVLSSADGREADAGRGFMASMVSSNIADAGGGFVDRGGSSPTVWRRH